MNEKKKKMTVHEVCQKCASGKVVVTRSPVTKLVIYTTCSAYSEAGRMRQFNAGWCLLGASGNKP